MKSIFRYPGGKSKVQQRILAYQPEYERYVEPFVGGGSIFFGIPPEKERWINDFNPGLISVYQELKNNSFKFINDCKAIPPQMYGEPVKAARKGLSGRYNARLMDVFDQLVESKDKTPALSYFFINRTVWGGRVNYAVPSRLYFSNPSGWNIVKTNRLEEASKILQNVKITCMDFEEVLAEGENAFAYLDPPYYYNNNTNKGSQLYEHCFSERDHHRLRDCVKRSKHKICLSYEDCDFIRNLYDGFNIHEETWTYCGTANKVKEKGKELIITNY